jgi:transcriptional regulator with XRE-family HTH domain
MSREKSTELKIISERIAYVRKDIPVKDFADMLGVKPAYIYALESGINKKISPILAKLISILFNFEERWLLLGEGPMHAEMSMNRVAESLECYLTTRDKIIKMVDDMDEEGKRDILKYTEEKKQAAAWRRDKELKGGI